MKYRVLISIVAVLVLVALYLSVAPKGEDSPSSSAPSTFEIK